MSSKPARALGLVGTLTGLMMLTTLPAQAKDLSITKVSGDTVSVDWTVVGPLDGATGNLHVGYAQFGDNGDDDFVEGFEFDYQCPDTFVPTQIGSLGVTEAEQAGCEWLNDRYLEGGDITVDVSPRLASAVVTGTVYDVIADEMVPIDLTVEGTSPLVKDETRDHVPGQFTTTSRTTTRTGTVSGTITNFGLGSATLTSGKIVHSEYRTVTH
ncbi:MAG: hypothetical protein ACK5MT_05745 [Actinomycetales bacterium]